MFETILSLPWWIYAVIFTFLWSVHGEANRHYQADGLLLLIWRSFFGILILFPVACFMPWPDSPVFYLCVVISGVLFSYNEAESFKLAKDYGGLFLSLQAVIWTATAIILWWVIDSSSFWILLQNPVACGVVLLGLVAGIYGQVSSHRAGHIEYNKALGKIALIAVFGGLGVVSVKYGMQHTHSILSVFVWSFTLSIAICVSALIRLVVMGGTNRVAFFDGGVIRGGFVLALIVAVAGPLVTLAFAKAPNPGFANIVTRLSTLWLYIYCLVAHKPAHVNMRALVLIVIGAVLLIYGTQIAGF